MEKLPNDIINIIINKLDKSTKWSYIQICKKYKKYGYKNFNCEFGEIASKNNYINILKYANLKKFYGFKTAFYGYVNLLKYAEKNKLIIVTSFITNYAIIGGNLETIDWTIKTYNFNSTTYKAITLITDIHKKRELIVYLKEKKCPNIEKYIEYGY